MKASDYLYYIPYIAFGLIAAAPDLTFLEPAFAEGRSGAWLWGFWTIAWWVIAFLCLWLAERRGILLPSRPDGIGPSNIVTRLVCATIWAKGIFIVAGKGFSALDFVTIILMAVFLYLFLYRLYMNHKNSARTDA